MTALKFMRAIFWAWSDNHPDPPMVVRIVTRDAKDCVISAVEYPIQRVGRSSTDFNALAVCCESHEGVTTGST